MNAALNTQDCDVVVLEDVAAPKITFWFLYEITLDVVLDVLFP